MSLFCNIHKRSEFSNCKEERGEISTQQREEEGNLVPKKEKKEKSRTQNGSPYKGADLRVLHSVYTVFLH